MMTSNEYISTVIVGHRGGDSPPWRPNYALPSHALTGSQGTHRSYPPYYGSQTPSRTKNRSVMLLVNISLIAHIFLLRLINGRELILDKKNDKDRHTVFSTKKNYLWSWLFTLAPRHHKITRNRVDLKRLRASKNTMRETYRQVCS